MAIRSKLFWQHPMLLALLAVTGSFSIGLILLIGRPGHQTTSLPLTQSRQGHSSNPNSISATQTLQQVRALKSPMVGDWKQEAKANPIFSVPRQFQGTIISAAKLTASDKVIALTFDDGPWPKTTEQVLDILKQHNIKATFFWVGQMVQNYPRIAQKVATDGNAIGNHTWHHWFHQMNEATAASEIERTAGVIYKTTGVRTSLFRPPGGILNNGVADYAKKNKYGVVMWSDDSIDYRHLSVPRLVNNVLRKAQSGGIVLMHDGGGNRSHTVEALPQIIDVLRKRGYRFVTVPQLLEMQHQERAVTTAAKPALPKGAVEKYFNP